MFGMRKDLVWGLWIFCLCSLQAQNPHVYSQYFMNPYVYNPALAGVEGHNAVFLMYRQQWAGLQGAPQVGHVNWHTPLRHAVGLGALITNDRVGPLVSTSFSFTTSYLLNLDRSHFFRFGLSLGLGHDGVSFNNIIGDGPVSTRYEDDLAAFQQHSFHLTANFGMMYHFGRFNIGASLPHLLGRRSVNPTALSPVSLTPIDHVFFKVNYRQSLFNDAIAVEPHILYRYSKLGNSQYEGSFVMHIAHAIWVGASYRQHAGIVGLMGFKLARAIALGYAYDLTPSDLSAYAQGSHEIHVGFHLGNRFDHAEHVHSFIKSEGEKKEEDLSAWEDDLEDLDIKQEEPKEEPPKEEPPEELPLPEPEDVEPEAPKKPIGAIARRGNHAIELPVGSYVIVGSFSQYGNAQRYSEFLLRQGQIAKIGYNSERRYFYVDMFHSKDVYEARARRDELRKSPLFADAWVLTIIEDK